LAATLQRDVATLRAAGFQVTDTIEGDLDSLSRTADATLAKVLHETLSNVHRHAEPRTACTIMISVSASAVELAVMSSTRIGEGSGSHAGLGLIGMRERVEASGGELQAGRVNDVWVVQVNLPGAVSRDPVREELR
jgi:signal transduction histidine kinase